MGHLFSISGIFSWVLLLLFAGIGVLNMVKVDLLAGALYLLFSIIYYPPIDKLFLKRLGFAFPYLAKVLLAFLVIWVSLAVGDLAEIYRL